MPTSLPVSARHRLLQLCRRLLERIRGDVLVEQALRAMPPEDGRIALLATGKAAAAMATGAWRVLGERIAAARVITRDGHCQGLTAETGFPCFTAGHPLPDARSLRAGAQVADWLAALEDDRQLLVLTSGGSSALLEKLPPAVSPGDLRRLNSWLLASGLDIHGVNRIRQSVSCIKGGGLLACVPPAVPVTHLIMSDVPGDDPAIIGSGLFSVSGPAARPLPPLPGWIRAMQTAARTCRDFSEELQRQPRRLRQRIIASNALACRQLAELAGGAGLEAHLHATPLSGDAAQQGRTLATYLREQAGPGLHIWGGETTVVLPRQPGRGGRNQHLALAAAQVLAGCQGITLLALGTDGSDGASDEDAGAIVDGGTLRRGEAEGLEAGAALQQADSGRFLEAAGDLISTGVTGVNVMDLAVALVEPRP